MSSPSAGFFARLVTILSLRANLYYRRQASRGALGRVSSLALPILGGWLLVSLWGMVGEIASILRPRELAALGAVGFTLVHFLVVMEVVALVGRGEGMAVALHHFPLSPALIHSSEMLASALNSPATLGSLTLLLSGARFLGGPPGAAFAWALLGVVYIFGLRRMLQLALANLLRRRFLREGALAAVSAAGLGLYLGATWLARDLRPGRVGEWLEEAPAIFWMLPMHWFSVPFSGVELPWEARALALLGAPLLALAVLVVGFDLQDRAVFGEGGELLNSSSKKAQGPRLHLADRFPFSLVPVVLWATVAKELRVIRRDPFLMVMLVTQTVVLLALPFLMLERGPRGGGAYLPFFALLLVMGQSRPAFNSLGTEGRALRFLAQTPASRWHVLLGKSVAYGCVFAVTNALSLALACWLFDAGEGFFLYFGLGMVSLVVLLGMGNLVSVWVPIPWVGARAAAGGARSASAAAEGGVERPGCGALLIRMLLLQSVPLLVGPVFLLVLVVPYFFSEIWTVPIWSFAVLWSVGIYILTTWLAVRRLAVAEERILAMMASRGAA